MRNAHRPRALPNKKLPRGIERQDELLELIEKRFHQEDLIRTALKKKDDATAEQTEADEHADGVSNADTAEPADTGTTARESASFDEATATAREARSTETDHTDPSADASDAPYADETASASKTEPASDAPSADASDAPHTGDRDHADSAAETVTIRWHGQNETICAPRTWLTVFDTVRHAGDVITREVADRRFHGESYWKTCDALYLSTGTYYHHVRAILHYAFACAVYHRLIDPRPKHSSPKAM